MVLNIIDEGDVKSVEAFKRIITHINNIERRKPTYEQQST
tara:strand:+ start:162 stop:281 length:120 start_codon:yes stop_codon:yes gene_type:complete